MSNRNETVELSQNKNILFLIKQYIITQLSFFPKDWLNYLFFSKKEYEEIKNADYIKNCTSPKYSISPLVSQCCNYSRLYLDNCNLFDDFPCEFSYNSIEREAYGYYFYLDQNLYNKLCNLKSILNDSLKYLKILIEARAETLTTDIAETQNKKIVKKNIFSYLVFIYDCLIAYMFGCYIIFLIINNFYKVIFERIFRKVWNKKYCTVQFKNTISSSHDIYNIIDKIKSLQQQITHLEYEKQRFKYNLKNKDFINKYKQNIYENKFKFFDKLLNYIMILFNYDNMFNEYINIGQKLKQYSNKIDNAYENIIIQVELFNNQVSIYTDNYEESLQNRKGAYLVAQLIKNDNYGKIELFP